MSLFASTISWPARPPASLAGIGLMASKEMDMARRFRTGTQERHPVSLLWALKILTVLGGHKKFVTRYGFEDDDVARELGFGELLDNEDAVIQSKQVRLKLDRLYEQAARETAYVPDVLSENVRHLGGQVGLSEVDMRILEFVVMMHSDDLLAAAGGYLGDMDMRSLVHAIAVILDLPEAQVAAALQPRGLLAQSGLLTIDKLGRNSLKSKLDLISHGFAELMLFAPLDMSILMREAITPSSAASLTLDDYAHLSSFTQIAHPYLQRALQTGRTGVNVLLYGPPGTGKSELTRVLAKELGCRMYEVSCEDEDGDPLSGKRRLNAFRAAQCLFAKQQNTLLVFDEIEDIFRLELFHSRAAADSKGWVSRMMEHNAVPTIWLSNDVECLDAAMVRRFDLVQEMPVPPRSVREGILRDAAADMLDDGAIKRLSQAEQLSPAVVTRSAAVVRSVQDVLPQAPGPLLETLIANTMVAQGLKRIPGQDPGALPQVYDPAFIHADTDMAELAAGIRHAGSARICLYGAPGTGKTAFARWLAEQIEAPLCVRRSSDIFSKWLGESEKNIARAFAQATQEKAVLLLDEVDSFLADRRGAKQRWETAVTNEMLTQMEAYPGIFIASTNLMDNLDEASLRRFDLKVELRYLRPQQARNLFLRYCTVLGWEGAEQACLQSVEALKNLALGDFAAVLRQSKFRPLKTPEEFAQALQAECMVKQGGRAGAMGFL